MPQMMPLMWAALFITFSLTLMSFMAMNFFSSISQPILTTTKSMASTEKIWKW